MSISILSFPILQDFSDEIHGDIYKCDFLTFYNEMFQYVDDLHISVNQYFLNDQGMVLQVTA